MNKHIKYLVEKENLQGFDVLDYNDDENSIVDRNDIHGIIYKEHPKSRDELLDIIYQRLQRNIEHPYFLDIDTSQVDDMSYLFSNEGNSWDSREEASLDLSKIKVLNLSTWNTSNVKSMYRMFYNCKGLTSVDLSSFDTSNVTHMGDMFSNCWKLKKLDLSHFRTPKLEQIYSMFFDCYSLTELDVSNFDVSNIESFHQVFALCSNITKLDLSGWNTTRANVMANLFDGCVNLKYLDISNFDTYNVVNMQEMFSNCYNLEYVEWPEVWDIGKLAVNHGMFRNCDVTIFNSLKNNSLIYYE